MEDVIRIHASSGTTGTPTVVGYTKNDIALWGEVMARTLVGGGASKGTILQVSYGYGLFTGGLGVHYGGERLGCSVIPVSGGNTSRQIQIMKDFQVTMLACTPSYALHLAEAIEEAGILDKINLKSGCFGAEPWSNEMREEIQRRLNLKAYDIYGLSEIIGPGVSFECECQNGMHINEDHFIPEIIDPETGKVLPHGELGELVFTTVTKEALPLIRYRTRDITRLIAEPCACGRTTIRMEKPCGRTDDMLIIRGVNVFPSQIESVLMSFDEVEPHYVIIVDKIGQLDTLEVHVELSVKGFSDAVRNIERLEKRLTQAIHDTLGLAVKVRLVEPKSIPRSEGKAKRVIDKRK
jgi:phenylacetate-CoA ligase